jgi:hypothetical protein
VNMSRSWNAQRAVAETLDIKENTDEYITCLVDGTTLPQDCAEGESNQAGRP